MAQKITFPPSTETPQIPIQLCFTYDEPAVFEFDNSGYFSNDNAEAFEPNPPTGNFIAPVTIGPYTAVAQDSKVKFTFFDTVTGQTFTYEVTISARCP